MEMNEILITVEPAFDGLQAHGLFCLPPPHSPVQWEPEAFAWQLKQPGCEAYHSLSCHLVARLTTAV
jgi:hypothetical protein